MLILFNLKSLKYIFVLKVPLKMNIKILKYEYYKNNAQHIK